MSSFKEFCADKLDRKEPFSSKEIEEINYKSGYDKLNDILNDPSEWECKIFNDEVFKRPQINFRKNLYFAKDIQKVIFGTKMSVNENPEWFNENLWELKCKLLNDIIWNDRNIIDYNDKQMVIRHGVDRVYIDYIVIFGEEGQAPYNLEFAARWGF